jgi:hypothetical protein
VIWACIATLPASFSLFVVQRAVGPRQVHGEQVIRLDERNGSFSIELDPLRRSRERLEQYRLMR